MTKTALAGFYDTAPPIESFRAAVLTGLGKAQKEIPSRFIYDARGSALFEAICALDTYYLTSTEIALLRDHAGEIAALAGQGCYLVEFGSGSSEKIRIVLDALDRPAAYVPVDISREILRREAEAVAQDYPTLEVHAVCADFTQPMALPWRAEPGATTGRSVGFFPGSTIGNFTPAQADAFLRAAVTTFAGGVGLLIGVDLKKDRAILEAAYNDPGGVSAAFNLNILARAKLELGADFDLARFRHRAVYDGAAGRMEIGIESLAAQTVRVAGRTFDFMPGEVIRTQVAYKFTAAEFQDLSTGVGLHPERVWIDAQGLFSLHFLRAT